MMQRIVLPLLAAGCVVSSACHEVKAPEAKIVPAPAASAPPAYVLSDTEVRDVASVVLGRTYRVFVSLPRSYHENPTHRFPVLFVTDADYAFPLVT